MKTISVSVCCFALLISLPLSADRRDWQPIGPHGGFVSQILTDRIHPNLVFSVVNGVLYRSNDYGGHWIKIAYPAFICSIHPIDGALYCFTGYPNFLFVKSTDQGQTFTSLGSFSRYPHRIQFDHYSPGVIYAFDGTLYRSTDDARTWQQLSLQFGCPPNTLYAADIFSSPFERGKLYVSAQVNNCRSINERKTPTAVIFESNDYGSTWKMQLQEQAFAYEFAWDAIYPDRVFAFNGKRIRALNFSNWTNFARLPCPGTDCYGRFLTQIPGQPDKFFLQQNIDQRLQGGGSFGRTRLLTTTNGGRIWRTEQEPFGLGLNSLLSLQGLLAATSGGGLYRLDRYNKWQVSNNGIESRIDFEHVIGEDNSIYAYTGGYQFNSIYRSQDAGKTWTDLLPSLPEGTIQTLAVNPQDQRHIILEVILEAPHASSEFAEIYVSRDAGKNWQFVLRTLHSYSYDKIFFDSVRPSIVYYAINRNLYKSIEFGLNPIVLPIANVGPFQDLKTDVAKPDTILMTNGNLVFRSNEGGVKLRKTGFVPYIDEGDRAVLLEQVGEKSGHFFLINDQMDLYLTQDFGERWHYWSRIAAPGNGNGDPPGAGPVLSMDAEGKKFLALSHGALFESLDGGHQWRKLNHEFRKKYFYIYEISAPRNAPLIAATVAGLFRGVLLH